MTETDPEDPGRDERPLDWWGRHRDAVLYPAAGLVVAALGLVWPPVLSMILTPAWMLLLVWYVPARIERAARIRS